MTSILITYYIRRYSYIHSLCPSFKNHMPSLSLTAVVVYFPLLLLDIRGCALLLKPYFSLSFKAPALSPGQLFKLCLGLVSYSSWPIRVRYHFQPIPISHQAALPLSLSKHLSQGSSRHNTIQCSWLKTWPTSFPLADLMKQGISRLC